ncbi:MAG: hypothetical protein ACE5EK_11790 [Nitrospinales bacterium]
MDFTHIKYGVALSLVAILFGGVLGLSFGCCEDFIKSSLEEQTKPVLSEKYKGDPEAAKKVVEKSWVYLKRAHFHSQTMGIISIVFSIIIAWLGFNPKIQMGVSLLGGFGSLGYGIFWFLGATLAPGMGSTGAVKESIALVAQASGGAFFIAGVSVFTLLIHKLFVQKKSA